MSSCAFSRQMVHFSITDDLFTNTLHQGSTSRMKLWPREMSLVADKMIPAITNSFSISSGHVLWSTLAAAAIISDSSGLQDYCTMRPRQGASSLCRRAFMHDPRNAANCRVSARRVYTVARPPPLDSRADRPGTDCLKCCASAECSSKPSCVR